MIALDLGNKQTKMVSEKGVKVFPSNFAHYDKMGDSATIFKTKFSIDKYAVNFDPDFEYAWGKDVNDAIDDDQLTKTMMFEGRYKTRDFRLLASFAIGEIARDFEEAKKGLLECIVVTGVPTEDFTQKDVADVVKALKGDHNVKINETSYNIRVNEVYVIPQPVGTIYYQMLNDAGEMIDESYLDEKVTVTDIGGGTLLIDRLDNLQRVTNSQEKNGAYSLYERIKKLANDHGIKGLTENKIEKILRVSNAKEGYFFKPNKHESIDITPFVLKSIEQFTREIISSINATIKGSSEIDRYVFTGGGANLLDQEQIKNTFKYTVFTKDSEIANVMGYFKYGKALLLEQAGV